MPGIGPLTPALAAVAEFFGIGTDLVDAAAERPAVMVPDAASSSAVQGIVAAMPDREKTGLLARFFDGDPQAAAELRAKVQRGLATKIGAPPVAARTVGELGARARAIGLARERATAEKVAAERKCQALEAEKPAERDSP